MKPPFFVFAHLPKCGGSTFIDLLRKNFARRFYHDHGLLQDYQYSLAQMSQIIAKHPRYDCIASHRYSFALPFDDPACPRSVKAIAFVRDPVDRALSSYFFHRQRPGADTLPRQLDLLAYFEKFDRDPSLLPFYKDGQSRFLVGSGGNARLEELIAAGHAWVFPLSRFDDALLVLESRFPKFFRDCSYVDFKNRTHRDQPVPDRVREIIARHQDADFALCRLAERSLDAQLQQLFPNGDALQSKRIGFAHRQDASPAGSVPSHPPNHAPSPFFVFAHLPKCGGTTFIDILRRNLAQRFYHDFGLIQDYQYSLEQMSRLIGLYPRYDCVASHRYSFALPFDDPACPRLVKAITFVRDPVERALSNYFFHRRRTWVNALPAQLDLLSHFQEFDRRHGWMMHYKDGQTRLLAGVDGLPRLERLLHAGHALIFPLSRFDDAMLVLEARFPQHFKDCSYLELNHSPRPEEVTDEVRQLIAAHQQNDFLLCRLAQTWLDAALAQLFPDPAVLAARRADFASRKLRRWHDAQPPPPRKNFTRLLQGWLSRHKSPVSPPAL